MSLNFPEPFVCGINSKALTSSLSGDSSLLKLGSFSFGSPVSASTVSKPILEIEATEDNNKITTPMLSGSGKKIVYFGSLATSASTKISCGGFTAYYKTSRSGVFKFGSTKGGSKFALFPKIKTEYVNVDEQVIPPCHIRKIQAKNCDRICGRGRI